MSLIQHPIFKGKLVEAWTEPTLRNIKSELQTERFRFVVDETNTALATVTDKHTIITNCQLVQAFDNAAKSQTLTIEPIRAIYRNGRALYRFKTPQFKMKLRGLGEIIGMFDLCHDYRNNGITLLVGFNTQDEIGQRVGAVKIVSYNYMKNIDERLYNLATTALYNFSDKWWRVQDTICTLTRERVSERTATPRLWPRNRRQAQRNVLRARNRGNTVRLIDQIITNTPNCYISSLAHAMQHNARDIGRTYWALTQAIAEVATHRMQQTSRYNFSADDWALRQWNLICEYADTARRLAHDESRL